MYREKVEKQQTTKEQLYWSFLTSHLSSSSGEMAEAQQIYCKWSLCAVSDSFHDPKI